MNQVQRYQRVSSLDINDVRSKKERLPKLRQQKWLHKSASAHGLDSEIRPSPDAQSLHSSHKYV